MPGVRGEDGQVHLPLNRWALLGRLGRNVFKKSPNLSYLYGAIRYKKGQRTDL